MVDFASIAALLIFSAVIVSIIVLFLIPPIYITIVVPIWRKRLPLLLSYTYMPVIGIVAMLTCGSISFGNIVDGIVGHDDIQPYGIIIIFMAIAYIATSLDMTGIFVWTAMKITVKCRSRGHALFFAYFGLSSILTIFTSNYVVIMTITPIICYFARNPTNLIVAQSSGITFRQYSDWMALPTFVACCTGLLTLYIQFYNQIPVYIQLPNMEHNPKLLTDRVGAAFGIINLFMCLSFLAAAEELHWKLWVVTLISALFQVTYNFIAMVATSPREFNARATKYGTITIDVQKPNITKIYPSLKPAPSATSDEDFADNILGLESVPSNFIKNRGRPGTPPSGAATPHKFSDSGVTSPLNVSHSKGKRLDFGATSSSGLPAAVMLALAEMSSKLPGPSRLDLGEMSSIPLDSGTLDLGETSTRFPNSGMLDLGATSSSFPNSGMLDLGATSSRLPGASRQDLGNMSSIPLDSGTLDLGETSSSLPNSGMPDLGATSIRLPGASRQDLGEMSSIPVDSGALDLGETFSSLPNSGRLDLGATSSRLPGASRQDLGEMSSIPVDSGALDLGETSTSFPNSGMLDLGATSSSFLNSGMLDIGATSSRLPGTSRLDLGNMSSIPLDSGTLDLGETCSSLPNSGRLDLGATSSIPLDSGTLDLGETSTSSPGKVLLQPSLNPSMPMSHTHPIRDREISMKVLGHLQGGSPRGREKFPHGLEASTEARKEASSLVRLEGSATLEASTAATLEASTPITRSAVQANASALNAVRSRPFDQGKTFRRHRHSSSWSKGSQSRGSSSKPTLMTIQDDGPDNETHMDGADSQKRRWSYSGLDSVLEHVGEQGLQLSSTQEEGSKKPGKFMLSGWASSVYATIAKSKYRAVQEAESPPAQPPPQDVLHGVWSAPDHPSLLRYQSSPAPKFGKKRTPASGISPRPKSEATQPKFGTIPSLQSDARSTSRSEPDHPKRPGHTSSRQSLSLDKYLVEQQHELKRFQKTRAGQEHQTGGSGLVAKEVGEGEEQEEGDEGEETPLVRTVQGRRSTYERSCTSPHRLRYSSPPRGGYGPSQEGGARFFS
eukprot:gene7059-156_t